MQPLYGWTKAASDSIRTFQVSERTFLTLTVGGVAVTTHRSFVGLSSACFFAGWQAEAQHDRREPYGSAAVLQSHSQVTVTRGQACRDWRWWSYMHFADPWWCP